MPTGEVFDGEEGVRCYHGENFAALPDFAVKPIAAYHGDDAVAEEAWVSGTHLGVYHGLPPTGRFVRVRVCGIYVFEQDRLLCERVYYDLLTLLRALGIARDPDSFAGKLTTLASHPFHLGRTFGRAFFRRRPSSTSFRAPR